MLGLLVGLAVWSTSLASSEGLIGIGFLLGGGLYVFGSFLSFLGADLSVTLLVLDYVVLDVLEWVALLADLLSLLKGLFALGGLWLLGLVLRLLGAYVYRGVFLIVRSSCPSVFLLFCCISLLG